MALLRYSLDAVVPAACRGAVVTIGNFDGVHRGHQALVREAVRQAQALRCSAVAVTLDPHPWQVLRPSSFQPLLTTIEERAELLHRCGADHVLVLHTTPALLNLDAGAFFERIIRAGLGARALVEGYNFAFGHNRGGTIEVLQHLCQEAEIPLTLVSPQEVLGKIVSSSRVRTEILAGAMTTVQEQLGRPYRLRGTVVTGQRRGQALGIPTANLEQIATLIPGDGVFAARAWHAGKAWPAAANVGPNPTFGEQTRKVEIHLIDFQGDLYGQELTVDFLEKIRATRPFASAQELVAQIQNDIKSTRTICAACALAQC
jgi:riboflavin kinase / FMN adenylyltransferase